MALVCLKSNLLKYNLWFIFIVVLAITLSNIHANSQKQLVDLSETIRKNELDLLKLQNERELLEAQKNHIKEKITHYHSAISTTIVSGYKLNSLPLKILLNNKSHNYPPALSYSLFVYYNKYLKNRTSNFLEYVSLMEKTNNNYNKIANQITHITKLLEKNSNQLQTMLANGNNDISTITKHSLELVKESNNIRYLVADSTNKTLLLNHEIQEDIAIQNQKNKFVWPNSGYIQSYYKESSNPMYNNGLTLLTLSNSQIVSPMDGEVVFIDKGDYLGLQNIIIIKHSASYYSMLIGNYTSFVNVTQLVKAHQPSAITNPIPSLLYFEMQYQNTPINPTSWLKKRN